MPESFSNKKVTQPDTLDCVVQGLWAIPKG